ncbi:MAG: transporter permease [Verrucomicrobiales bacterium]|nr:transporter permease [Verrucomicrobiales bacterium]
MNRSIRSLLGQRVRHAAFGLCILIGALVVLETIVKFFHISSYLLPPPTTIFYKLFENWGTIAPHLMVTTVEALTGFLLATVIAICLAVCCLWFPTLEKLILPMAVILQTVPVIVLAPVLVITLGNGIASKVVIAALIAFFPTFINAARGLVSIETPHLELFQTLNANRWQTLLKLRVPTALPYLFASLRIAAANCYIGAVIGEWVSASKGIGYLAQVYLYQINIDLLYATVLTSSFAALAFAYAIGLVETLMCPWSRESLGTQRP